jgi:alanine racemase
MFPETRMDMVRIGIMQYGWSSRSICELFEHKKSKIDPLHSVITWKSKVMSAKKVAIGDFIGYGTSFLAEEK